MAAQRTAERQRRFSQSGNLGVREAVICGPEVSHEAGLTQEQRFKVKEVCVPTGEVVDGLASEPIVLQRQVR